MDLEELLNLLNENILNQYQTKLIGGFSEPFYKARTKDGYSEIQFCYDYPRSALHELAHWCIAGKERRDKDDYGYWYSEDGRSQVEQELFFKVEIKPQAIEWAFCKAIGLKFEPSLDNLYGNVSGAEKFGRDLNQQIKKYQSSSFPNRAEEILNYLTDIQQA